MGHQFNFFRAGGFNQVRLSSGADLMNLDQLDQKLWVALACPTKGLVFDAQTLNLIDIKTNFVLIFDVLIFNEWVEQRDI